MNFSVAKGVIDNQYAFLFPEQIFDSYISGKGATEYYAAGYAYYDVNHLHEKIIAAFGEPLKTLNHYRHLFAEGVTKLDERAYIYEHGIVCLKNKVFAGYTYDDEEQGVVEEEREKEKIKIDVLSTGKIPELNEKFTSLLSKNFEVKRRESELSILCFNQMDGFYLKNVKTIKSHVDIEANYNEGFKEVSDHIIEKLNQPNEKGIVLLYGLPGCGKTHYVRHLTKEIKDKNIIYIPPDFAANIANPDFVAFFLDYTNSILIIEDAETILKSRKSGGNQSVANLLNISDGLLGDGLKLQILCTFNCDIGDIDEALLREGRLIAEYKFDKLSKEKTQNLLEKVYKENAAKDTEDVLIPVVDKEMTLAEIFNHKEKRFVNKKIQSIGFRRN